MKIKFLKLNKVMQTNENKVSEDGKYYKEHSDHSFWMQYPDMETGKYEIPVVYDESFGRKYVKIQIH